MHPLGRSLCLVSLGLLVGCSGESSDGTSANGGGGAASGGASTSGGSSTAGAGGGTSTGGGSSTAGAGGGTSTGGASTSGGAGGSVDGGTGGGMGGSSMGATGGGSASGGTAGSGGFGTAGADGGPAPNISCTLLWESGFENGFPGEFGSYDDGSWSPSGDMPDGRVSAWTIIDRASAEPVLSGDHAYRGWIIDSAADSHRPYPGIYEDAYSTPLVNTFWVYLDVDYARLGGDWVHFGTWGNDDGQGSGQWALHTMSVRERKVEFAHTEPFLGEYIGPQPQPDFPLRQWVRFTVYVLYEGTTGYVQAWQDGVPVLRADVAALAENPGTSLITAHWGMYAAAGVDHGRQYNDDIRIWALDEPLQDLETEPLCGN